VISTKPTDEMWEQPLANQVTETVTDTGGGGVVDAKYSEW